MKLLVNNYDARDTPQNATSKYEQ